MVDGPVTEVPVASAPVPEPVAPPAPVISDPNDPFSVDETRLSSWAPEQRAVLDEWRKKASTAIEARGKTVEEKYKTHVEKANALEELARHPKFQQWYSEQQKSQSQPVAPNEVATADEWSAAIVDASNGLPQKLQAIQTKMWSQMATPVVQQIQQKQQQLEMTIQMKNLWERYPDAKELDKIGRSDDPNDKTPSLLEIAMMHAVEGKGQSVEEGYKLARKWADSLNKNAKQAALGIVQDKKDAITSGPSSSHANKTVVEVSDFEELTRRNMEALLSGQTPPKFVIRGLK